jgi:hypothetical protein
MSFDAKWIVASVSSKGPFRVFARHGDRRSAALVPEISESNRWSKYDAL